MIPKINFRYSNDYDKRFRTHQDVLNRLKEEKEEYPSREKIMKFIEKVKPVWAEKEKEVLKEISKITKLKWQEDIRCYVIGYGRSFPDPLTVRVHKTVNRFIDILTHELIHQIYIQNRKSLSAWWEYISKKYSDEPRPVKIHIFVHAVHKHIYLKVFNKLRLTTDIKRAQRPKALTYRRAWEIVDQEGYLNIVKKFHEVTK